MMPRGAVRSDEIASELAARVSALQRVLRRRIRAALDEPRLSAAEGELLNLVASHPGLRVGDAAIALRLAPNTVSTIVRRLVHDGLLVTKQDTVDRRGVRLRASAAGNRLLRRWRSERTQLLTRALEQLSESDHDALTAALPILAELAMALEEERAPL